MKRQIASFSIGQSSKILALLYGVLGLVFVPIGIAIAVLDRNQVLGTGLVIFYICAPIAYAVIGYVFGLIGFWVYNLIAGWVGGFEFELRDVPSETSITPSLGQDL